MNESQPWLSSSGYIHFCEPDFELADELVATFSSCSRHEADSAVSLIASIGAGSSFGGDPRNLSIGLGPTVDPGIFSGLTRAGLSKSIGSLSESPPEGGSSFRLRVRVNQSFICRKVRFVR